ncbi:hypothetical protein QYE76_021249 [Lolium multiflorum]|uniref:Uncharacterized protein n=1 Tax=Lolium multiflorum TaxID=4521 RepID=A0AAD8R8N4_LOLMU|nr:hypothetical protein QYE76_021249 [Lolium multiflorum]
MFMIREGESLADAYGRLGALRVKVKGLGCEKYNDGFEMNEAFIKSKVIAMIAVKQKDTNLALNLQIITKSADLNADDLVSYVAANENMAKTGERLMAMNHVDEASHNLALKARADHEREEVYEIEEDEEMTSTSDIATDFAFFAKKYKAKFPMFLNEKKKKRTCYNCDEDGHFANECPYEKRVDKPKFVKGVKPRLKPNPINDRYKKNKGRAFVGAEYTSDEEEEDEEKEAGVAGLAFSKPGSLFTYDYSKDYSTENDVGSSFMARTTQDDDSDDSPSSTIVGSWQEKQRCISQGLKQQIETYELDKVKDLETIERAQLLAQELDASKKELEVAHASLTRDLDHLERANKLAKDELKKLGENHDLLQETYKKALVSMNDPIIAKDVASSSTSFTHEHAKLVEEHVRLQEELSLHVETNAYLESLVTKYGLNYHPNESSCEQATILEENVRLQEELSLHVETNAYLESLVTKYGLNYHPNESSCEQATILEENVRLTKELAKFTTAKNKMGLDDLLSKQRSNNQKFGLGYASKSYKKNNYKKEKPTQEKNKKVTNVGKASKGKATSGDRTGPNNHYDLFVDYYGDVYARYVGPQFITFAKKAQRMYESEIKAIRTDNGTEFKNYTMQEFVDDEGIKHEFSAPYTPQQNGVVERKNRTIIEMARTMLSEFNSPHNFWGEAISTAVHYSNRLFLRPLHNKTPYELLTGNKPNVMYIRVFGCKCLVKNNKGKLGKFETRTIEGTFVGYAENSHAYRYYNKSTGTIEVSCDVVFLEDNGSQVEQVVPCVAGDDDPSY